MRALILLSVFAFGCTATQLATTKKGYTRVEKAFATVLVSDAQEKQIGDQLHAQLEQGSPEQPPIKYVKDPQIVAYVEGLAAKLTAIANQDRQADWHVHVIDDPKTVNAFATPGSHIYVYTGLLLSADSEHEVVGVLAHEIGHVVGRHAARTMVDAYGLNLIAGLALGENPGLLAQLATAVVGNGTLLAHSRADENEADQYAVKYSARAGYDPSGIASFFEKLSKTQGSTPRVLTWLSTHPAPADRVERVNATIQRDGLAGVGETGAGRLDPIKAKIKGLAPVAQSTGGASVGSSIATR